MAANESQPRLRELIRKVTRGHEVAGQLPSKEQAVEDPPNREPEADRYVEAIVRERQRFTIAS